MKKTTLCIISFAFLLVFQLSALWGQSPEQRNFLRQLSTELEAAYTQQRAEAIRKADSLGIVVRQEFEDGTIIELQGFSDGRPVYFTTYNLEGAQVIHSADVWSGGDAGFSLSGNGQTLAMWDGGATRLTHQEFTGRVIQADDAVTISDHATHVAATMVAAGTVAAAKGMSYQASLDAYDWNNDDAQMAAAAADGTKVSQHSYGTITGWRYSDGDWYWYGEPSISETEDYRFGFYNARARNWDIIANNAPHYLIVKSAGNDRGNGPEPGTSHYVWIDGGWQLSTTVRDKDGGADGYDCISTNGTAKNIMTVGAVTAAGAMSSFSSWGPTDDGRIKPDIVAKGVSVYSALGSANDAYASWNGTSMSGPMVSGSVGLLLEHWENLQGTGNPMLSSTVRGLIIHTAAQLDDPGPDYRNGWGMMNTRAAVELMAEDALAGGEFNIRELTLTQGQTIEITVTADGSGPLVATMVWNDPAGNPPEPSLNPTDLMLVNDLDMRIADGSDTWEPWILDPANPSLAATTGDNFRDNVEQVFIEDPVPGESYTITITHKNSLDGGSQDFSLILSGIVAGNVMNPVSFYAAAVASDQIDLEWGKNIDEDQVMLVWSADATIGIPEDGAVYNAGATLPGGGTVLYRGDDLSYSHTALDAETTYYYRLFSLDETNEYSSGRSANATTFMAPLALPYHEPFDYADGVIPEGWERSHSNWGVWNTNNAGGSAPEMRLNWSPQTSDQVRLHTPLFDATRINGYMELSFLHMVDWYENSFNLLVQISTNGGEDWTTIWNVNVTQNIPAATAEVDLSAYTGNYFMLAFVFDGATTWDINQWYIDDLHIWYEEIAEPIAGDVNNDGKLNILDVTMLINHIIGNNPDGFNADLADVNEDGSIDVADVAALINLILYGNIEGNGKDLPESSPAVLAYHDGIIRLQSDGTLAALYMEYYLEKGEEVAVELLQEGLQLAYSQQGNLVKLVVFSMGNTAIPAGEIPLIQTGEKDHFLSWGQALASNTVAQAVEVVTETATSVFVDDPDQYQVKVYPNPSRGAFSVQFTLPYTAAVEIQLFDLTGRQVLQNSPSIHEAGSHTLNVAADYLKQGIYLLHVRSMDATTGLLLQTWHGKVRIE